MPNQKVILLDRDGVINVNSDKYVKNLDELKIIEGSVKAISLLTAAGFSIFVVSNQSAIGRGLINKLDVDTINNHISSLAGKQNGKINGFYYCPHKPNDGCNCRKPKPGMLQQIEHDYSISLKGSVLVGDASSDITLARQSSLSPILVRTGNGRITEEEMETDKNLPICDNLLDAVRNYILK